MIFKRLKKYGRESNKKLDFLKGVLYFSTLVNQEGLMKVFIKVSLILSAMLLAFASYGQSPYRETRETTTTEHLRQPIVQHNSYNGFIDPSRIKMDHQMGMGFSSGSGRGYSQGYYMNTISYKFDAPVMLRLRTGITNNPYSSGGMSQPGQSALSNMFNEAELFGGADLVWKPKDNVMLKISIDQVPNAMWGYPGTYGYNRWPYGSRYHPMTVDPWLMEEDNFNWLVR